MRAALIAEGKSDCGFVEVLARLCRDLGVAEIEVEWANELLEQLGSGATVEAKISTLLRADPEFDFLFVHRDADKAGVAARREEIHAASARCGDPWPLVEVIPIREMEAWLLVDDQKLREVVGNPKGTVPLGLPKLSGVEACTDPKTVLRQALNLARAKRKRKRQKQGRMDDKDFGLYRARLLETLDIHGPVTHLEAWQQLVGETGSRIVEAALLSDAETRSSTP